jgi:uncharacterized RDD family membrane protein YckC
MVGAMAEAGSDQPLGAGGVRQRLGHLAGSLGNRVLEELDADAVVQRVDVDGIVARLDIDGIVARIDVDALVGRVDLDALLDRVDVHRLVERVDLDVLLAKVDVPAIVARIDLEAALADVDLEALVRRAGIPQLIADSTGQVAGSALDLGRRQLVGLDVGVSRVVQRLLRRDPDALPAGPDGLVADGGARVAAPAPDQSRVQARTEVSGFYAGPVSRLLAFGGDAALATSTFAAVAAGISWLLTTLFGVALPGSDRAGLAWALALTSWQFWYWWLATTLVGRTPVMALAGLRVVTRAGAPVRPGAALLRTLFLPLSLLGLGIGGAWMLVDGERRALHDLLAGTTVVYDWGGRPAEMPTPLARWIEAHDGRG